MIVLLLNPPSKVGDLEKGQNLKKSKTIVY